MIHSFEPSFFIHRSFLTRPPVHGEDESFSRHLAHRISRNPTDLTSHVQRIFTARRKGDLDALYGALVDLFITLGEKGKALRCRILNVVKNDLTVEQYSSLENGDINKPGSEKDQSWIRFSRLYQPCMPDTDIVVSLDREGQRGYTGVLEQARDLIDCGEIDTARQIMEEALQAGEQSGAVHDELLNIYRHTRDYEGFLAMWTRLDCLPEAIQESWKKLDEYLAHGGRTKMTHHG